MPEAAVLNMRSPLTEEVERLPEMACSTLSSNWAPERRMPCSMLEGSSPARRGHCPKSGEVEAGGLGSRRWPAGSVVATLVSGFGRLSSASR
jgi:hypothetical protein